MAKNERINENINVLIDKKNKTVVCKDDRTFTLLEFNFLDLSCFFPGSKYESSFINNDTIVLSIMKRPRDADLTTLIIQALKKLNKSGTMFLYASNLSLDELFAFYKAKLAPIVIKKNLDDNKPVLLFTPDRNCRGVIFFRSNFLSIIEQYFCHLETKVVALLYRIVFNGCGDTKAISLKTLNLLLPPSAIERLNLYIGPGLNEETIMDLCIVATHLYLSQKFCETTVNDLIVNGVELLPFQHAVLIGVAIQKKNFQTLADEYRVEVEQVKIHFKKSIKSIVTYINEYKYKTLTKAAESILKNNLN